MDHSDTHWPDDPYKRALAGEPQLQALDQLVQVLAANAPKPPTTHRYCSGCIWELILKPLTVPWVGWERGLINNHAPDTPKETTAMEEWLRSTEAYDAVMDEWLRRLQEVDPGNGHGIHGLTTLWVAR